MKKLSFKIIAIVILNFFFISCELVDDIFPEDKNSESFVAEISAESDFDFLTYSEEDQSFFAVKLRTNANPEFALIKPNDTHEPIPIWFNTEGYPEKMVIEDHIFSFANFTDISFDIGIVSPEGEILLVREVLIPEEYREYIQLKSINWSDGLRWAGHITGAVACGASIIGGTAATVATFGISAPAAIALTAIGCSATALSIATEFFPEEIQDFTGLPATAVSAFSTTLSCINPSSVVACLSGASSSALTIASAIAEEHENEIALAQGAIHGGYGDIQITLSWDSDADIDLYVQDPNEEWIWFRDKISTSGGWLDVDDTNGYGPENIFWEENSAPNGDYMVYVKHYAGSSANYSVLIQAFGQLKQYSGYIGIGQEAYITDFSPTHLKNAKVAHDKIDLPFSSK